MSVTFSLFTGYTKDSETNLVNTFITTVNDRPLVVFSLFNPLSSFLLKVKPTQTKVLGHPGGFPFAYLPRLDLYLDLDSTYKSQSSFVPPISLVLSPKCWSFSLDSFSLLPESPV